MRSFALLVSAALAATSVLGRTYTTTLPFEDGNTIVVDVTTDPLGDVETDTLSTITPGLTASTTTSLTTALTTTPTTTRTRTRTTATTATTTATGPVTTTGQRVVGVDTTAPPMRTTTYWYDPGDGNWVQATWTASVTAAPTVATALVPAGTIQDYNSYQEVVNSVVLASAVSAEVAIATGGAVRVQEGRAGWAAVAVGVIGAGLGAMAL